MHEGCDPKIIHRDVKAANILLDEKLEAVVGDFGLARIMDYKVSHVVTGVMGTLGHIPMEYLTAGRTSDKTDVFGYGIMLFELISGKRGFDLVGLANEENARVHDWVSHALLNLPLFCRICLFSSYYILSVILTTSHALHLTLQFAL